MNTTAIRTSQANATAQGAQQQELPRSLNTRVSSLAMAAMLTLAMLAGVDTLAVGDTGAPQLAQASTQRA